MFNKSIVSISVLTIVIISIPLIGICDIWKKHINFNRADDIIGNNQEIWVYSENGGLSFWNMDTGLPTRYYRNHGLPTSRINGWTFDEEGNLIIYFNDYPTIPIDTFYVYDNGTFKKLVDAPFNFDNFAYTDGCILITKSFQNGVYKYDGVNWDTIPDLSDYKIIKLFSDPRGGFWAVLGQGIKGNYGELIYYNNGIQMLFGSGEVENTPDGFYFFRIDVDQYGIIWASLKSGVAWYDGEKWNQYYWEEFDTRREGNVVRDKNGQVWVATGPYGLLTNNGSTWEWVEQYKGVYVNKVEKHLLNGIWVATDTSLELFDGEKRIPYMYENMLPIGNSITAVDIDSDGNLWCGDKFGDIAYLKRNTWQQFFGRDITGSEWESPDDLRAICSSSTSGMWMGFKYDLIRYYGNIWISYYDDIEQEVGSTINKIEEDNDSSIWVATNAGIAVWHDDNWEFHEKKATDLTIDANNNVWILDPDLWMWDGIRWVKVLDYDLFPGIKSNYNIISAMSDGSIWIGGNFSLFIINKGNVVKYYDFEDGFPHDPLTKSINISALKESPDGTVWILCSEGLLNYDGINFRPYMSIEAGIPIGSSDLAIDSSGRIFIVGGGLTEFTPTSVTLKMNLFTSGLLYSFGDILSLQLMINNYGPEEKGDLYFVMISPEGKIYSGLDWIESMHPLAENITIPEGFSMPMIEAFKTTLPAKLPLIEKSGKYYFALGLTDHGSTYFRSKTIISINFRK